jgi:hypothetical protein
LLWWWPVLTVAIVALGLPSAASAGAPGRWETVSGIGTGEPDTSSDPGVFRTADGVLHVGWVRETGPLSADLLHRTISLAGALGPTTTIVSGWVGLADPAFLSEGSGLRIFFGGQNTTNPDALIGVLTSTGPLGGASWTVPELVTASYGTVSATRGPDGTPFQAFESLSRVVVHRGLSPSEPSVYASGLNDASSNIVTDAGGQIWVAWCAFGPNSGGIYVAPVNPATGAPGGAAVQLPGSLTEYQGGQYSTCVLQTEVSRRIPLVARVGGGVFAAGAAGYPTLSRVNVWRVGSGPMVVANAPTVTHSEEELAAAPDGRIWAAWVEKGPGAPQIVARRSNRAASVFGAAVHTRPPAPWTVGSFELSAQPTRLDVLAQLGQVSNAKSLQHTQLLPGLTLVKGPIARRKGGVAAIRFTVLDAGDPVAGAQVAAGGKTAVTRASGRATIVVPAKPKRTLQARATRAGYVGASIRFRCC